MPIEKSSIAFNTISDLKNIEPGIEQKSYMEKVILREEMVDGIPKPSSEMKTLLTQFVFELGYFNHHMYVSTNEKGEKVLSARIDTMDPNFYIERRCEGNFSELIIGKGKKELGTAPKSIDMTAMLLRTEINRAIINQRENGYIPEKYKTIVDGIKYMGIDIDGCLFDTEDNNVIIDEEQMKKFAGNVQILKSIGIETFLITGRGLSDVKKTLAIIESFGGEINEANCENGSIDYDRINDTYTINKEISEIALTAKNKIFEFLKRNIIEKDLGSFEDGKVVGISLNPNEKGISVAKSEINLEEEIKNILEEQGRTIQAESFKPIDIYKMWIKKILKKEINNIAENEEEKKQIEELTKRIVNSATAVDINPCIVKNGSIVGITKIEGINNFLEKKGLDVEDKRFDELAGIGDTGGDLFLKRAKLPMGVWNSAFGLRYNDNIGVEIFSAYETTKGVNDLLEYVIKIKKANILAGRQKK